MIPNTWTEDRIADLTRLWGAGLTASQIAGELGVTRNAVIGKRTRLGLPERLRELPKYPPGDKPKRLYARAYPEIRYRDPPTEVVCEAAHEKPCSLFELNKRRCHWPVGDPGTPDFYFCGGDTNHGSYCGFHSRIAYQPNSARKQYAGRAA